MRMHSHDALTLQPDTGCWSHVRVSRHLHVLPTCTRPSLFGGD